MDGADGEPTSTVPNASELSMMTAPKAVVPPTGAANRMSPPFLLPPAGAVEMVIVKAPLPFRVLLK